MFRLDVNIDLSLSLFLTLGAIYIDGLFSLD